MTQVSELLDRFTNAYQRQSWQRVHRLAAQLLPLIPQDAQAHFIAGQAHIHLQQVPQALDCLHTATQLQPANADYAVQYAKALTLVRRMNEARQVADHALTLEPSAPSTLATLGMTFTLVHAYTQAVVVFRRLAVITPGHAHCHFNLATALIAIGDFATAEDSLETCIRLEPHHWNAHLALSRLSKQTPMSNHIARLQALLSQAGTDLHARMLLGTALAKEHEDLGDYAASFDRLAQAKSAGRHPQHDAIMRHDQTMFEQLIHAFPETQIETMTGDPSDAPIFIIGMPRTGTTLLERILSSHPDVHSAGELQSFATALQHAAGSRLPILFDPDMPDRVPAIDWRQLGAAYLANIPEECAGHPHFIDKMPHNFLYAGFIARALPHARIICLRRDPLDTCLSNFRHLFEQDSSYYEYSFDLLDTAKYFVMFDRLLTHWQRVLPGRIFEVQYEALVESQEASSRQLLAACGLPWNDACLHFEDNPAPAGSNAVQVRTPIYRTALGRWKNYEPQLDGLRELLARSGIAFAS
ncbi:sulfotransferase [Rhodanobacter glycinis]|uniref:Sulfotransferase n=1 Tax=Rhodanobacter glycinis TaxID=582702 RepID=A0A5B9DZV9_9GAMM|nr:sulfotransferase [Rhodanobacter glycinis]